MSDEPLPRCCACAVDFPASVSLRIVPRRDVKPITEAVRRATAWPGAAAPVDVEICGRPACHNVVRSVAVSILAATPLDTDAVVTRTVRGKP